MFIKLGPILRFHGSDNNQWEVSALLVVENEDGMQVVTYGNIQKIATPKSILQPTFKCPSEWKITRHDMSITLTDFPQQIRYTVDGSTYFFSVPARESLPRCSYASCNGFSDPKLMKKISNQNERWDDLNEQHTLNPYHLFIMGGDQIYSDSMWHELHTLRDWSETDNRFCLPCTQDMQKEIADFFYKLYIKRWSQPKVSKVLSAIPTLMMWDDHDIFDGWGSYPDE